MTLQERVNKDIIEAMKSKDKERLEVIRFLKSLFIQNNTSVKPIDEETIVIGHAKKLQDSLVNFPESSDLYKKTKAEILLLAPYLPAPIDAEEVKKMILAIKSKLGSPTFGDVMKELTPQIKGKFDGKMASDLVKTLLA